MIACQYSLQNTIYFGLIKIDYLLILSTSTLISRLGSILFRQITTFIKVTVAFVFGLLQTF